MTLPLIKVFPYMKFHFNSISRSGDIFLVLKWTRNCKKGNNLINVDARVMNLVHDTHTHQYFSILKYHLNSFNRSKDIFGK